MDDGKSVLSDKLWKGSVATVKLGRSPVRTSGTDEEVKSVTRRLTSNPEQKLEKSKFRSISSGNIRTRQTVR